LIGVNSRRVYLDASILVALHVSDALSNRAIEFVDTASPIIVVSDFCVNEASSAIARKFRTGELSRSDATDSFAQIDVWLERLAERVILSPADIQAATRLVRSLDTGLRVQDALHVAMAMRLELPIATFDEKLASSSKSLGLEVLQT
jgi:uncharacterized protein